MRSSRLVLGGSAIVFVASAAMTIATCASMAAMGTMEMPGGWTMSHMWMRMPGQSWLGAFASFVGMWAVMMVAMMLPSLVPTLVCYRTSVARVGATHADALTGLVVVGYFAVWAASGAIVFPVGVLLAELAMRAPALSRTVPMVGGVVVLIAGAVQHTRWKRRHLAICRDAADGHLTLPTGVTAALQHGLRLGFHCIQACAALTLVALVCGVMNLHVMAAVAAVITAERLAPAGVAIARAVGVAVVAAGLMMISIALRA